MANRVLGIEYTDDRIKIVEVGFGRRLKVFNFAVVDNRNVEPERRAEQLNHALQVRGFEAKDAIIATSGGNVEHRLLTLPPLSTREMHFVMQRESKKLAPTGMAEMLWSYDLLKTKEELGIKKNQILLVTAERTMVDAAQNFMSQTRLKLLQVTTVPEAVLNLLRQVTAWKKDAVRTVVHFAGNAVHVLFAQDGALLLSREIHFDNELGQDEQIERLVNELKRSTLYFRQNFPQSQLDQIVFSGDSDILGTLATRSFEELGLAGSIIRFEENLDTSTFRGNWDEFRFHLPSLTAALGAGWRKNPGTSGVNLLPGKTQAKEQAGINPTKIARVACMVAVGFALLTGVYYLRGRSLASAEKLQLVQRTAIAEPKLQAFAQAESQRRTAEQRTAFLRRVGPRANWSEILRSLSFIVPATGVFEDIRVEGEDAPKMTIKGYIQASSAAEGNADFSRFFSAMRALPFFKAITMPRPTNMTYADTPGATPVSGAPPQSKLSFEIVGELP